MSIYLASCVVRLLGWQYSGSGNWLDDSGNGHDATPQNSPTFTSDSDGQYFSLNGTNQGFVIGDHADYDFTTGDFTVMVRARSASLPVGSQQELVSKTPSDSGFKSYALSLRATDNVRFRLFDGTNTDQPTGPAGEPDSNDIFTAAGVRDVSGDDDTVVYVADVAGTPGSGNTVDISNAANLCIGQSPNGALYFAGDIWAVVIWNTALTAADIATAGNELTASSAAVRRRRKYLLRIRGRPR